MLIYSSLSFPCPSLAPGLVRGRFKAHPMRFVFNPQGQARYAKTFDYLIGE